MARLQGVKLRVLAAVVKLGGDLKDDVGVGAIANLLGMNTDKVRNVMLALKEDNILDVFWTEHEFKGHITENGNLEFDLRKPPRISKERWIANLIGQTVSRRSWALGMSAVIGTCTMAIALVARQFVPRGRPSTEALRLRDRLLDASSEDQLFEIITKMEKFASELREELHRELVHAAHNAEKRPAINLCMAWIRMYKQIPVEIDFGCGGDQSMRSECILLMHRAVGDPTELLELVTKARSCGEKQAIVLSLGDVVLGQGVKAKLVGQVKTLYQHHPDPGVHSASEWVLSRWTPDLFNEGVLFHLNLKGVTRRTKTGRGWYISSEGHTMSILPWTIPGQQMASEKDKPRFLSVSTKELSRWHFQRFLEKWGDKLLNPRALRNSGEINMPQNLSWFDAAAYCNWLSHIEGRKPCYAENSEHKYGYGMFVAPNHAELDGYRLPTVDEWDYACRAGAATDYFYGPPRGTHSNLMEAFAEIGEIYQEGDAIKFAESYYRRGMARKRPNCFGLFDVHGNMWEWCHDPEILDGRGARKISNSPRRSLRGGAQGDAWEPVFAGRTWFSVPDEQSSYCGLRIVRTLETV